MSEIYFVTHPEVVINASIPVTDWSLSEVGIGRMRRLLSADWVKSIRSIYCSTEKKAVDGAVILSEHLNIPCTMVEALGENDRTSTGYLPPQQFETMADQFFASPSVSIRGWETAESAQKRIVKAVTEIVETDNKNGSIAIVSHGAVGALLLCHLNQWSISRDHDQPGAGGGNYFSFSKKRFEVQQGWTPIESAIKGN
jgi:broad specificity phosphatase PhoE